MNNNQGTTADKLFNEIDYERQSFENLDINPYEIVVAVAKEAREINDKAQKFLGPEFEVSPANMALRKLDNKKVEFVYDEEKPEFPETPASEE